MYAVVELHDEGKYTIIKQGNTLSELQHTALDGDSYPSVFVSKEDLYWVLVDASGNDETYGLDQNLIPENLREPKEQIDKISDQDMIRLSHKLQDHLVSYGGYWDYLLDWLNERGIKTPQN